MTRNFLSVVLVLIVLNYNVFEVQSAKILGLFPAPMPSHYILGHALMKGLAAKGHHVTMVSSFKQKNPVENYTDIVLEGYVDYMEETKKKIIKKSGESVFLLTFEMIKMVKDMENKRLEFPAIKNLLKSKEKYDLIITETIMHESMLGFAHQFDVPVVLLSTISSNIWMNHFTKNPEPIAYCPQIFTNLNGRMNFLERVQNTITSIFLSVIFKTIQLPMQQEILTKYFPDAPEVSKLIKERVSIVLLNSHQSVGDAKPFVPNMIEIGGFHIDEPKELPKDLKDFADNAKDGFILFSMGSSWKSTMLNPETLDIFLKVFEKLPYQILWKFEDDNLPGKPSNVRIEKWLPQNDLLAHPNLKLFITHGGLLSTTETVYHGVPIVGIPILGDQSSNMKMAEKSGIGKAIELNDVTYEGLLETIYEVLNNNAYRENVKKRSRIMRDRPMKPIDTAIYWIEYALRHKFADHLKTAAMDLTWYQEMLLDVIAFLGTITLIVFYIFYRIIKKMFSFCRRKREDTILSKKKKQ